MKQISVILGIVVIIGAALYGFSKIADAPAVEAVFSESDWVRGPANGNLILIEYGDFQCPACAAYEPFVQKLMGDYKDTLRVVYRHFPLSQIHANALPTAYAAEAAGLQGKFWEMHDLLFERQKEWENKSDIKTLMIQYAEELKLDRVKFSADYDSSAVKEKVSKSYTEGLKLKVNSTPTFFLNGKKLGNPRNYEEFKQMVEESAQKPL